MTDPGDLAPVQRRTVRVLATSQVLGGIGVATGISVSALIASRLSGSDVVAGLTQTAGVVGAALAAVPLSRAAARSGRRVSLVTGYATATVGAVLAAVATTVGSWPLLVVAMLAFGAGTASGLASRFTATDLATPQRRATDLSVVIWATTVGSVLGPNLAGPMNRLGAYLGLAQVGEPTHGSPAPTAFPYVLSAVAFALAGLVLWLALRPDPLHVARAAASATAPATASAPVRGDGIAEGWAAVRGSRAATSALAAIVLSHTVMVALMSMTPVHMDHGGASLEVVGVVISAHIAGMYALSPVIGRLADVWGHARVLVLGAAILLVSAVTVAGAPSDDSVRLTVGLVLLGVGWSCGLVAGSALLVDATPSARTSVQGLSDLVMNVGGAVGGLVAGAVIAVASYAALGWGAALVVAVGLVALGLRLRPVRPAHGAA
ncbi:putative MFS family arabinose efflux permease [Sediminihabitans luteus]|uniref:Putative MFS family arabinose efflux permease n=1 Tax=Sediminihabitans luteus TaxID=1138585 RepID=A0A2M9D040_9CELL|nr:MFS transporter [Sediminihabitans luteus]PJJ77562.1 putative MFS family arabinose efflux permease [Sediminihabitans luteus]GII98461.1 tetracycline resistance protein [Sediminihabitans luteus]